MGEKDSGVRTGSMPSDHSNLSWWYAWRKIGLELVVAGDFEVGRLLVLGDATFEEILFLL